MDVSNGFYAQNANALIRSTDGDTLTGSVYRLVVPTPTDLHRKITLIHGTVSRYHIHGVDGFDAKIERSNLRKDCS